MRCGCGSTSNPCANHTLDPDIDNLLTCGPSGLLVLGRSPVMSLSEITALGHSFGRLGASEAKRTYQHRLAEHYHVPILDLHVSGAELLTFGVSQGGLFTALQTAVPPVRAYGAQALPAQLGIDTIVTGINDLNSFGADADMAQFRTAMDHAWRTLLSWRWAATYHDAVVGDGITLGGAGWTTPGWLNYVLALGAGTGTATNANAGRTITIAVPANYAGRVIALAFLTQYTGGGGNHSALSFTVDAVATEPIGLPGGLDTQDINPATVGNTGVAVARFLMPDDGLAHTIVVTTGTGGTTFNGWWPETPRPIFLSNIARPLDAAYTNGSDAKVSQLNTDQAAIVAEFGAPVYVVDAWTALPKTQDLLSDNIHPNDDGYVALEAAFHAKIRDLAPTATEWGVQ